MVSPLVSRCAGSLAACAAALLGLVHCGGSVGDVPASVDSGVPSSLDSGAPDGQKVPPPVVDEAGTPDAQCKGGSASDPGDRPQPVTCPTTTYPWIDAGGVSCVTVSDCVDAGAELVGACREGKCVADQCLTDEDCPSGQACGCSNQFAGNAIHTNACVPAQCRVDADCGKGGSCSPSSDGYCGGLTGFYCHSANDTCTTSADCCANGPSDLPSVCRYSSALGHFACQTLPVCSG